VKSSLLALDVETPETTVSLSVKKDMSPVVLIRWLGRIFKPSKVLA
jgi:hypothetical protein